MEFLHDEIKGLLTDFYEPKKKALYMELHNRAFPLDRLDENCKYCGSKAYYKLKNLINFTDMAKEKKGKYELVDPTVIVTLKNFNNFRLDASTPQDVLEAVYNAGFKEYVKLISE